MFTHSRIKAVLKEMEKSGDIRLMDDLYGDNRIEEYAILLLEVVARLSPPQTIKQVRAAFTEQSEWDTAGLQRRIKCTPKKLYNALGNMVRRGEIKKDGYGRYKL